MATSPESPEASVLKHVGLGQACAQLAITGACPTPGGSILRTNARRIVQNSVAKEIGAHNNPLHGALDHFSMFEKVTVLEAHNAQLQTSVRDLTQQLNEAMQRCSSAEAEAAAAKESLQAAIASTEHQDNNSGNGMQQIDPTKASKVELIDRIKALEQELLTTQQERRQAHNRMLELKGAIRVLCRVRPTAETATSNVRTLPDNSTISVASHGQTTSFAFSRVFGPQTGQQQVFREVSELCQSALDGYHVCLMSYGQTGSGKTYSMMGGHSEDSKGIIPRALDKLLEVTARLRLQGWRYQLEVSCTELYNNSIRDLLSSSTDSKELITDINAIKHDASVGTIVVGVSKHEVTSTAQALTLLSQAMDARVSHATACNAASSRSHCVFWLHIHGQHATEGTHLAGSLCLVDLAGSERLERSLATGDRKMEAAAINSSLSSLGDVFEALSTRKQHVPYRNSKLTYLLKPCLSPGGKVLFMVHINPEPASTYESLTSLRFATKVAGTELGLAQRKATLAAGPCMQQIDAQPALQQLGVPAAESNITGKRTRRQYTSQIMVENKDVQNKVVVAQQPAISNMHSTDTIQQLPLHNVANQTQHGSDQSQWQQTCSMTQGVVPAQIHAQAANIMPLETWQENVDLQGQTEDSAAQNSSQEQSTSLDLRAALRRKRQLAASNNNPTNTTTAGGVVGIVRQDSATTVPIPPSKCPKTSQGRGAWH